MPVAHSAICVVRGQKRQGGKVESQIWKKRKHGDLGERRGKRCTPWPPDAVEGAATSRPYRVVGLAGAGSMTVHPTLSYPARVTELRGKVFAPIPSHNAPTSVERKKKPAWPKIAMNRRNY